MIVKLIVLLTLHNGQPQFFPESEWESGSKNYESMEACQEDADKENPTTTAIFGKDNRYLCGEVTVQIPEKK